MHILLTGGLGYIGSHVALDLLRAGYNVTILDTCANASPEAFAQIKALAGAAVKGWARLVHLDIRDTPGCRRLMHETRPDTVIHLAGLKDVAQSMREPERYFKVNLGGTKSLLLAMQEVDCKRLVFSSSAAIYGNPQNLPIKEEHPCFPVSPYGHSKYRAELMIGEWAVAAPRRRALSLRYFNPVGCVYDPQRGVSLSPGEEALMNRFVAVAAQRAPALWVYGGDYDTPDGSGQRDYVHVADLASAHVAAVRFLDGEGAAFLPVNLGTGRAITVLELAAIFQNSTDRELPLRMMPRREGDIAASWADVSRASSRLGWRARQTYQQMCVSAWWARDYRHTVAQSPADQNRRGIEYSKAT